MAKYISRSGASQRRSSVRGGIDLGRALRRHQRLHKLQELRWEVGKLIPAEQKQLCSQREQEFSQEYNASLDRYMNDVGLDLTSDQAPPRGVFIDVLALEDLGTIVTDSGMSMTLKKDTLHRVRRCEVEHLIRQGSLEERA